MDIRQITPRYSVTPQIDLEDLAAIKDAGFVRVVCNRPDAEIPPSHHGAVIEAAAKELGLEFFILPLTHQTMTPDNIAKQMGYIQDADGPVLAYCASGTRCTVIWALGQAGQLSADEILSTAAKAGYQLEQLRPQLEG